MKNLTTRTKVIASVSLVFILIIAISCYTIYTNNVNKTKYLNGYLGGINNQEDNFYSEDGKESKLDTLKSLENDYQDYLDNSKYSSDEVNEKYLTDIQVMKQYFKDKYSQSINDNIISNLNSVNDRNQINSSITNLNNTLKDIKDNQDIIFDINISSELNDLNQLNDRANDLVTNYTIRIKAIDDKAVADAKIAQDAKDAADKAANDAKAQNSTNSQTNNNNSVTSNKSSNSNSSNSSKKSSNNTSSNNNNYSSSSGNSSKTSSSNNTSTSGNTNSGSTSNHGSWTCVTALDENGNEIPESRLYRYQDGTMTDYQGNALDPSQFN